MESSPDRTPLDGPPLDLEVIEGLRELGGDDEPDLLLELIETFLDDAPERLAEMTQGVDTGDLEMMARAAHTLKSAAANMGAMLLSRICSEMEMAARDEDARRFREMTEACRNAYDESARALRRIT